ncbi:MAG: methionine--tRNA ligase [Phycisphaerae bacterium]
MPDRYLVTAGLPYSNGRLHVGHIAGAYLPADTYVRYLRAAGHEARFICGSDDNGVAALKTAREENRSVESLTAEYNERQAADFAGLGIKFDIYGGTHQPDFVEIHEKFSQELFLKIHEKGYFTKRRTMQLFDPVAGQFLPDRYVQGTCPHCCSDQAYGDQCESCGKSLDALELIHPISKMTGTPAETRETVHWFLRLDQLEDTLRAWMEGKQDHWRATVLKFALGQMSFAVQIEPALVDADKSLLDGLPEHKARLEGEGTRLTFETKDARDQACEALRNAGKPAEIVHGLPERAMTRDLTWGVPVPLDDPDAEGKVLYVWFDAPIGYVSFTGAMCANLGEGEGAYADWWKNPDCKVVHFIGEDNTVFHAIIWPAMLLASHDSDDVQGAKGEYQLPHNVVANAFVNVKFPGKDEEKMSKSRGTAIWIEEYLKQFDPDPLRYYLTAIAPESARTTFDVDDFITRNNGELLNALGNFFNRCITFAHKYFDGKVPDPGERQPEDIEQLQRCATAADKIAAEFEACRFKNALAEIMALARDGNGYFDLTKPFMSRKTDMDACGRAINVCLQTARALTTLMAPILPHTAASAAKMLQLEASWQSWSSTTKELPGGHTLGEAEILVKRLDAKELFGEG